MCTIKGKDTQNTRNTIYGKLTCSSTGVTISFSNEEESSNVEYWHCRASLRNSMTVKFPV